MKIAPLRAAVALALGNIVGLCFCEQLNTRPVTVTDMIEMTQPGDPRFQGGMLGNEIAKPSPDGTHFLVLLKRGNLKDNTNEYWIECFRSSDVMLGKHGTVIARFSSSSNRPAIRQIEWINNHTITFIGENRGVPSQLYSLDIISEKLYQFTHSAADVTAYACDSQMEHCAYLTQSPLKSIYTDEQMNSGIVVTTQPLIDLVTGKNMDAHKFRKQLYVQTGSVAKLIEFRDHIIIASSLYMSPNGRSLIVRTMFTGEPPQSWHDYKDLALQMQLNGARRSGEEQLIYQFEIVDVASGTSHPLLSSPIPTGDYPDVAWSADSYSVILSGILLPLDESNEVNDNLRSDKKFVAELSLDSGRINPITSDVIRLDSWDPKTGELTAMTGSWSGAGSLTTGHRVAFSKVGGVWEEDNQFESSGTKSPFTLRVHLEEGMNSPPKIFAEDKSSHKEILLMDLNPQFKNLELGQVRDLGVIKAGDVSVKAGIYLPVDYKPGVRYPLVIQTHEWSPDRFWIDGPFNSAFAAQAFAGKGFIVAQIALNRAHVSTPREVEDEAAGYDAVIKDLDDQGMVDTSRIGIIGFSRSALGVKYALTHSRYRFAAATIADGSDEGYFRYIGYLSAAPWQTGDAEGINGGTPTPTNLQKWFHNALDLDVAKASTPIRLEAYDPEMLAFTWELFGLRRRLDQPVDFIYLPDGQHVLVKPKDRITSQQGNVDWFRFWLQRYEDPDPAKKEQYQRWEHLR